MSEKNGRLLRTRMAELAAAMGKKDANSQVAAHSTGPGHIFKFEEAEILARGDNRASCELLEPCFSGPQLISKRNDLPFQYSVLRHCLSKRISHVERTGPSNNSDDSEHNCRVIIEPTFDTDKEIAEINESNARYQENKTLVPLIESSSSSSSSELLPGTRILTSIGKAQSSSTGSNADP